ncbi:MAG: T9SS C-terminal target domain-containing protein, partial [Saprospiraceae bacterium]|nr:T9SS C-terminal target domain-containing protein [Candidatus Defluviibacterium haderslevense]
IAFTAKSNAQTTLFQIAIEPMNISGLGGLQAFPGVNTMVNGLIISGRLDGFAPRTALAALDIAGHNNQLMVIDVVAQQNGQLHYQSLPIGLQEQLSSTNMEFFQEEIIYTWRRL